MDRPNKAIFLAEWDQALSEAVHSNSAKDVYHLHMVKGLWEALDTLFDHKKEATISLLDWAILMAEMGDFLRMFIDPEGIPNV